jgi:virginiamycin B lyase
MNRATRPTTTGACPDAAEAVRGQPTAAPPAGPCSPPAHRPRPPVTRWRLAAVLVAALACQTTLATPGQATVTVPASCTRNCVTTYQTPVPAGQSGPFGITPGPLDSEWFAYGDRIGRIDSRGTLTTYNVPTTPGALGWMARLRPGEVWFTERDAGKVGWIRVADSVTTIREYTLPSAPNSGPHGLVLAADRNVYITEQDAGKIAQLNPRTGRVREFTVPFGDPLGLTLGPDGALWFIQRASGKVGRMTLDGRFTHWSLAADANPNRITVGPDGNIWFTELGAGKLGRIIPATGRLAEYPIDGGPVGITSGKDGQLYVVLFTAGALARVNVAGRQTARWHLPGAQFVLQTATGRGLDIWVADSAGRIYQITPYRHGA